MKTSEMIAALEENRELKFKSSLGGLKTVCYVNKFNEIEFTNLNQRIRRDRDWQLVREPVTWQEAIQAWIDGKTIKCEYPANDAKIISSTFYPSCLGPSRENLITGTWYIID